MYVSMCVYIYVYINKICGPVTGICKHINEFSDPKREKNITNLVLASQGLCYSLFHCIKYNSNFK